MQLEGLGKLKKSTSSRLDPATSRLVTQCLNQLRYRVPPPSRQTIHNFVNKLRTTGLLIYKKQKHKPRVLTEEKFDDIEVRLEHTPRKSLKHLAQETGVS
jgi:transposase